MKVSKLTCDEWTCMTKKEIYAKDFASVQFTGTMGLIQIDEVTEAQTWELNQKEFVVCDHNMKWLRIFPKDSYYIITAMLHADDTVAVWYIDMIADHTRTEEGVVIYHDLYLDLVVYADGTVKVDDFDELEDALRTGDITQEQFDLACQTAKELQEGLLKDKETILKYTMECLHLIVGDAGR